MSTDFKEFSEAARLYAKYQAVVGEMEQAFESNLTSFSDAVKSRIAELPGGEGIDVVTPGKYVCWWLKDAESRVEEENIPYVWFEWRDAKIIDPGVLTLTVEMDQATDSERQQLLALKNVLKLPANCKIAENGRRLRVEIMYGQEDPVANLAEPTLLVLKPLYDLTKKWIATRKTILAAPKGKK